MDTNPTARSFIPYPTNRVVGTIADAEHADAAIKTLMEAGFDRQAIDVLHGDEDLSRLDPTGADHGVLERLQRALIRTGGPAEEYKHLMHHVEDVRAGRFVIMVLAPEREGRTVAADILNAHGAEFVGFYGRWAWEGFAPSSEQAATEGHAHTGRPEDIPRLFVEAWNTRDPDALASLFDSHAEFVNVTGLWWHDRASIRKAHAYGLERIFNASTLAVDELRLKQLSENVAIVHASMTLSGQAAIGAIRQPGSRKTIFSFVVHKVAGRWMCVSAHNTDVVPNMETNVISDDGTFRAANYRSGQVS
ncbi:MAG TPA: SgcJ/EcaC family oxidoreductase [Vicinamibacterales bacterium]|nr:SgcJ/EcaC family oxidoreductase [Vicinamibacterales bacterium]